MDSHASPAESTTPDALYRRSCAEIQYMADVYRKYGKHDLADELLSLIGFGEIVDEHAAKQDDQLG